MGGGWVFLNSTLNQRSSATWQGMYRQDNCQRQLVGAKIKIGYAPFLARTTKQQSIGLRREGTNPIMTDHLNLNAIYIIGIKPSTQLGFNK